MIQMVIENDTGGTKKCGNTKKTTLRVRPTKKHTEKNTDTDRIKRYGFLGVCLCEIQYSRCIMW